MSDIDVLFPGAQVAIGDEVLEIKPLTFGQLPKASRLLKPVAPAISALLEVVRNEPTALDLGNAAMDALATGGEDLLAFLAFAINRPREWFDALDPAQGVKLMVAVWTVNADFFTRGLLPLLGEPVPQEPAGGETSSQSSSQPATDAPT